MGFNTVRITTSAGKRPFLYTDATKIHLKNQFAFEYEIFPNPNLDPNLYGLVYIDPLNVSTDFNSILSQISLAITMAGNAGLKVILGTGGGIYLLNNSEAPINGNYIGPITMQHVSEYRNLLIVYANYFKNNTNILAYDLWNEPAWHDNELLRTKTQVCSIISVWYDAIKNIDQNHLITIGLNSYHDAEEWDPNVMKLDFISEHFYPNMPSFEQGNQEIIKKRYHNELLWMQRTIKLPWLIGETGYTGSNSIPFPLTNGYNPSNGFVITFGDENQQSDFTHFSLNEIRNAQSSGMAWWQFQDVHWYDWNAANPNPKEYNENWWGLHRRGNPINGDYSTLRKPLVSHFHSFQPGAIDYFDQNRNSNYYDPYNFKTLNSSLQNKMNGKVTTITGQPIADAVITGYSWTYTKLGSNIVPTYTSDDEPQGHSVYTFSDDNGDYELVPFNYMFPNDQLRFRIINYGCAALGCNRFPSPYQEHTANAFTGTINFALTKLVNTMSTVNGENLLPGESEDFNGGDILEVSNVNISALASSEITATNLIHVTPEFDAAFYSDVHLFLKTVHQDCIDMSNIRTSSALNSSKLEKKIRGKSEIEIQFKKTGRQILDAEVQPNPSNGIVYLLIKEKSSSLPVTVRVHNMLGQCLKTYQTEESQIILDGIQWQKGVYVVTVKSENLTTVKKVIIN